MSTLKTHNLQSPDAASVNIALAPNAGMVVTGISTFSATVKIGSSVPDAESGSDDLIVGNTSGEHGITIFSGTTSAGTIFFGDGTGVNNRRGAIRYLQSDDSFQFNTNGNSEKVRIKSNGFFGIGTTNPSAKLTVSDTGPAIVDIHHSDGGNGDESRIILGALALNPPSNRGAGIAAVNTGNGHDLSIKTSNTHGLGPSEKLRVKNGGSVGIGTTNPARKLEIFDDTYGSVRIRGGAGGSNSSRKAELSLFASGAREYVIRADAADAAFKIYDASDGNADRLYINSSGSLGVNLSTPKTTKGIHISKGAGNGGIGNSYSLANEYLHFGYSEHNSSGNLGLFTMGFGYVAGGTPATNSPAYFGYKEESTGGYTKGNLVFATRDVTTDSAPTERVRIQSDGEVFIGDALGGSNRSTQVSIVGADQSPTGVWAQVGVYSNDSQAANKGGSLSFGGQDGSTPRQTFAAIKGAKENSTSGNYAGYMAFYIRPAGDVSIERMRISSTGQVTKPNQIAFHVYDSISASAFAANTYADFNSVHFNRGNCYSTSNGRFTCTVAGTYGFWCNMLSNGSVRLFHEVRKNGSRIEGTRTESGTDAGLYQTNTTQAIVNMAVGDWVAIHVGSGGAYGGAYSSFCGYLLG